MKYRSLQIATGGEFQRPRFRVLGYKDWRKTAKTYGILAAAVFLAACQTPATRTVTKEVLVPVATHPIKPEQVPTPVGPLPKRPNTLSAAADILLSWHCRMVAYMYRADPLLRIAAGLPPRELPEYAECER